MDNSIMSLIDKFIGNIPDELNIFKFVVASLIFVYVLGFVFDLVTLMLPRSWRK